MTNRRFDFAESANGALDALFHPRSIAIVGASGRVGNPFSRPLHYLRSYGFEGSVYPINPGYKELGGLTCYPDLESLPEPVDLALMMVPAKVAIDLMPEVGAAGARAAVIFASGFGETGSEGVTLQRQLVETANANGIRLIGPNCQGALSTTSNMYGTFTAALEEGPITKGTLAYVGQSGAVGGSILSLADERGVGISSWVSTGNQADLTSVEIARYLIDQEDTSALALYIESAPDDLQFLDLAARAAELGKSLIVLRSAKTAAGARAAASHTGAIVGDAAAFHAVVKDYGVVVANDIDDLVDFAHAHTVLPKMNGPRIGVVTTSGGAGSLVADIAHEIGLEINELSAAGQTALSEVVPSFGAIDNPVDVTAQIFRSSEVDEFIEVCHIVERLDEIDGLMIVLTLVTGELAVKMANALVELVKSSKKPITLAWAASRGQTAEARKILREHGLPIFDSVGDAARVLNSRRHHDVRDPDVTDASLQTKVVDLVENLGDTVTEASGQALLALAGVPRPNARLVTSIQEAQDVAENIEGLTVLKIQSSEVLHKTELGGVKVGVAVTDLAEQVKELLDRFSGTQPEGVLVQDMAPDGIEFIIGVTQSEEGPPLVTIGLGGTATELFRDTATALAPISKKRARELISETKASALLHGFRGARPYDIDALATVASQISHLGCAVGPRLQELEVNPVRVSHDPDQPVLALDFLMRLKERG
ncbi:acetate--CoA ligase family protein [Rhodococcus koreensis]